jgi:hypothetical protein
MRKALMVNSSFGGEWGVNESREQERDREELRTAVTECQALENADAARV